MRQAVVITLGVSRRTRCDELQAHLGAHSGLAKDGFDVQQANATHFQQIAQQLGHRPSMVVWLMRYKSTESSATKPLPRGSAPAQFAFAQARLASDQHSMPKISMNTPWMETRSAKCLDR